MKQFIEIIDMDNNPVLINTNHIVRIAAQKNGVVYIWLTQKGFNQYPHFYIETKEDYKSILAKIDQAVS